MSDSVRPHRRQSTRLLCPWDSSGKKTGVGCHFLLQCMKVKSESEVAQSCLTLRDPMDCSPSGSSVHGICQARVLEWDGIAFSHTNGYEHTKKCSKASVIMEILINTTVRHHFTPTRMAIIKKLKITSIGEDVEKRTLMHGW